MERQGSDVSWNWSTYIPLGSHCVVLRLINNRSLPRLFYLPFRLLWADGDRALFSHRGSRRVRGLYSVDSTKCVRWDALFMILRYAHCTLTSHYPYDPHPYYRSPVMSTPAPLDTSLVLTTSPSSYVPSSYPRP